MAVEQDNTSNQELINTVDVVEKYITGTKAELLAAGKFKPEWFPGVKGNHKNTMTIVSDELRSIGFDLIIEKLQITRNEEYRGCFDIEMIFTEEEQARREQIEKKEFKELAYKEAADLAQRWIDGLPTSVEDFKKRSSSHINEMMTIIFNEGIASARGGYSFNKKTVHEFDLAVDALCNILNNGDVKFYQFGQEQKRRDYAAEAFNRGLCLHLTGHERDALVQRFMNKLNTTAVSEAELVHV